ncbi:MAG: Glu/Leu/Phe/Val dehydrogenase dimerization domain-containing protein [Sandaracinaceae bacterium]
MTVFENPFYDDHELVVFARDARAALRGVIAVHDSSPFGMAGGGLRIWPYTDEAAAVTDVLRLSRAMSYKLALANLPAGGAKMVVIADPRTDKTPELLRAIGRAVEALKGRFVVGTDVGSDDADLEVIRKETVFTSRAEPGHDTGWSTAHGVYAAIRWIAERRLERASLDGLGVTVQGVGHVGEVLARLLAEDGARLVVGDVDDARARTVADATGATLADPDRLIDVECDIFAPCALGDVVGPATIDRLRCRAVVGSANNPLTADAVADDLAARGIAYVPDFLASMGGVIGAAPDANATEARRAEKPRAQVRAALDEAAALASERGLSLHAAVTTLAREKLAKRRR